MAENIKRRLATARLAVAFVVAGSIAGAAWAQADPPTAHSSAADYFIKKNSVNSDSIVDGSLHLQDFHKGEVASFKQFLKLDSAFTRFHKAVPQTYLKIDSTGYVKQSDLNGYIKQSDLNGYIKLSDADGRYRKASEPVVLGDGSVFTGDGIVANQLIGLLNVPSLVNVEGVSGKVRITNTSGGDLLHTECKSTSPEPSQVPAGTLKAGSFLECASDGSTSSMQFFTGDGRVATLSFSSIPAAGGALDTVQILIGL